MLYKIGDIVTITVDRPIGGIGDHSGLVGVIMETNGDEAYMVTDIVGDSYWYYSNELRPVGVKELENAFVSVVKNYIQR